MIGQGALVNVFRHVGCPARIIHRNRPDAHLLDIAVDLVENGHFCRAVVQVAVQFLRQRNFLQQPGLVFQCGRDDVVQRHADHDARFDLDLLDIGLPLHLIPRNQFLLGINAGFREHFHGRRFGELAEHLGHIGLDIEPAADRLLPPFFRVSVAVEADDIEDRADDGLEDIHDGHVGRLPSRNFLVHSHFEIQQLFGNGRVQRCHGPGAVGAGTDGAELEAVAGEGERRGPVPVGIVHEKFRDFDEAQRLALLAGDFDRRVGRYLEQFVQHFRHRAAQEGGNNGRRRFVCTQAVCIGRAGDGSLQQRIVLLHGREDIHEERDELEIALRILARRQQRDAGVRTEGPVVVLAGPVYPFERLLVQEHHETVLPGEMPHQVHDDLVLVVGEVGLAVDGREFELIGRHFIMTGLQRNPQPVPGHLEVAHESGDAGGNGREIMVVQLLVLG